MRKSKLLAINQSPPSSQEAYRLSQKISIPPIRLLSSNYEFEKKNLFPNIIGTTHKSPEETLKKRTIRPSYQELKPIQKRISLNKNLTHRRASSNVSLMNKQNKEINSLSPLSNGLTPKTNAIFQYYISEVSQQLKLGNKYSCHDEENIFIQHMLVSICTRRGNRFLQIPTQPHNKKSIFQNLPTQKIKQIWQGKKILLFDIDETLVHVIHQQQYKQQQQQQQQNIYYQYIYIDKKLKLKYNYHQQNHLNYNKNISKILLNSSQTSQQTHKLTSNHINNPKIYQNHKIKLKIKIRTNTKQVLRRLSHDYILGIFTESQSNYAEEILKIIDPNKSIFSIKLFRQHCTDLSSAQNTSIYTYSFGEKIKDLRVLSQINPSQIILIDNSPITYLFQPENAIPIIPFFGNIEDDQMIKLEQFLHHHIIKCKDVRPILKNFFQISLYERYDTVEEVMNQVLMNTTR